MHRRIFLATSSALLTAGASGCLSATGSETRTETTTAVEKLHVKRIRVENHSGEDSLFNIDLARNGDHPYHSQLDVSSGETSTVSDWIETGRTFTVVGMSKQFGNYEMVALGRDNNQTEKSLEVEFVINERGDVEGKVKYVDEADQ